MHNDMEIAAVLARRRPQLAAKRAMDIVLSAAALTYVAALASSLAQLLRLVIISRGRNRD